MLGGALCMQMSTASCFLHERLTQHIHQQTQHQQSATGLMQRSPIVSPKTSQPVVSPTSLFAISIVGVIAIPKRIGNPTV